jgi:hypothetical protein
MALPVGIAVAIIATTFTMTFTKATAHTGTGAPTIGPSAHTTRPQIHLRPDRSQPLGNLQTRNKRLGEMIRLLLRIEAFLFIYYPIILTIQNYT